MDQMQARPQTVSRARARESANGNAVGLPHLQPAAVGQTAKNWFPGSCDLLKRDRTIRSAHNQKRNKSETLHPTKTLQIDGFFTASFVQGWVFLLRGSIMLRLCVRGGLTSVSVKPRPINIGVDNAGSEHNNLPAFFTHRRPLAFRNGRIG